MSRSQCTCRSCGHRAPAPAKGDGFLLQKIVATEKRCFPRLCTKLALALPDGLQPPYTLCDVTQSGASPWGMPSAERCDDNRVAIGIPVTATVRDRCGRTCRACGVVEVETALGCPCPTAECWRSGLQAVASVRLCCAEPCSMDCVFGVELQVTLEIYLTRPEVCMPARPACPEMPLYPPPIRQDRPHWQQCPKDPDPCGWPARG